MAIQTVSGEISEKELGATLPHEHLLIDLRSLVDEPKTGKDIFYQKLSLNNRYRVYNDPYTLYDNAVIDELEVAVQEMKLYKEAGGNSVVDVTLDEIGRDPLKLKYISEQSGVNIVMGCGHYTNASLPTSVHNATEKELAKEIINDVTVGVRGTGIKAGVIGEIGTSAVITPTERKSLTAAGIAAAAIGIGLQAFCIPGSVAQNRQVGLGHGNLGAMLLSDETECFCFLAGHESFAAAEGAISIALNANKVRKQPLRVVLNGLGKDAAYIISRINGFTFVETEFDPATETVKIVYEKAFSEGDRAKVRCYGADSVPEGVAIMKLEHVGVSITGNSTNPTRFQHPVAGTYKKWCNENGVKYFSVASGGGTGRTLHPDNMAAGPASYGMTDTMGRMHSDAQFAGSSSVPAHVEMMGLIGAGNNPMVGMTVACAVAIEEAMKK